jgi:hypothetical protein
MPVARKEWQPVAVSISAMTARSRSPVTVAGSIAESRALAYCSSRIGGRPFLAEKRGPVADLHCDHSTAPRRISGKALPATAPMRRMPTRSSSFREAVWAGAPAGPIWQEKSLENLTSRTDSDASGRNMRSVAGSSCITIAG